MLYCRNAFIELYHVSETNNPAKDCRAEVWYTIAMKVKIKLFASLRKFGPDEQVIELPENATIDDAIDSLDIPKTSLLRILNGEHRPASHTLKDGDELALFPPIAGG
jgi:molybdopterin converting factor small subunit